MAPSNQKEFEKIYPGCRSILGLEAWKRFLKGQGGTSEPASFPDRLALRLGELGFPSFLPELARLEWRLHNLPLLDRTFPQNIAQLMVNPTLQLLGLSWRNLTAILHPEGDGPAPIPDAGEEGVFIWRNPQNGRAELQTVSKEDLLALKIVAEEIDPAEAARSGRVSVGAIDAAIDHAVHKGILLRPKSRLRRDPTSFFWGRDGKKSS